MKIIDLIDSEQILYSDIDLNTEIARLAHDPKECTADSLLVLPNSKKPMAEINEAPTAVLCGKDAILQDGIKAVRVKSPRSAISGAYFRFYKTDFSKTKLIGITGTNGKTSTATFIKHAFLSEGVRVGFIGTGLISVCNRTISEEFYSMTTPDPWLLYPTLKRMVEESCEIIVMEVSSHSLELDKVAPLKFDIGVFTNLSMEHLDFHGDIEKYFEAKSKLFSLCDKAVINIDDYYGRRLACDLETEKVTVGVLWRGDAYVTNIQNRGFDGIEYVYHGRGYSFTMKLKAAGIYNIYNSMLAIAVCTELALTTYDVECRLVRIKRKTATETEHVDTACYTCARAIVRHSKRLRLIRTIRPHSDTCSVRSHKTAFFSTDRNASHGQGQIRFRHNASVSKVL